MHSKGCSVAEIKAQEANARAEANVVGTSSVVEEPRADETAVEADVVILEAGEERPAKAATEQVVTKTAPLAIVPLDLASVPSDITSPSGASPDVAVVAEEDTSVGPFTGPHAAVIQIVLDQFFAYLRNVMPVLLQDGGTSDAILAGLEAQVIPFQTFDVALADCLQRLVDQLRAQLNMLTIPRVDLEDSVERTAAELRVKRASKLHDLGQRLEAERKRSLELFSAAEMVAARH